MGARINILLDIKRMHLPYFSLYLESNTCCSSSSILSCSKQGLYLMWAALHSSITENYPQRQFSQLRMQCVFAAKLNLLTLRPAAPKMFHGSAANLGLKRQWHRIINTVWTVASINRILSVWEKPQLDHTGDFPPFKMHTSAPILQDERPARGEQRKMHYWGDTWVERRWKRKPKL